MASTIGTGQDYTTHTLWEAALGGGGADNDGLGADEAFDETFTINAGTNPTLDPQSGAEHDSTEGSGVRFVWTTERAGFSFDENNFKIRGYEFDFADQSISGVQAITITVNTDAEIHRALVHNVQDSNATDIIEIRKGSLLDSFVYNNQCTDTGADGFDVLAISGSLAQDKQVYNNTLWNNDNNNGSGVARGVVGADDADVHVKNNLVLDTGGTSSGTKSDYANFGSATSVDAATNLSSDSTAPAPATGEPAASSAEFVSTADPPDLRLKSGAESIDAGTDLGTTPSGVELDILERNRDTQGDTWDVGAHEFVSAAPSAVVRDLIMRGVIPFAR